MVAVGWYVDLPPSHDSNNAHLPFSIFWALGFQTTMVGPRWTSQRRWRFGNCIRNIEEKICEGRDHQEGIRTNEKGYLQLVVLGLWPNSSIQATP